MLKYLIYRSRWLVLVAAVSSIIAGSCSVLLVIEINTAINATIELRTETAWRFGRVVAGALIFGVFANILFQRLRQRAIADLRSRICEKVMDAPLSQLEQVGAARVQSALSDHVTDVAQFFVSLPAILTNGVIVAGCLVYMAILSWAIFLAGACVLLLGSIAYYFAYTKAMRYLRLASKAQDRLFGYFRSLTDGAKELKQNRQKRNLFENRVLGDTIREVSGQRFTGMALFEAAVGWSNFLIYSFIGLVIFVLVKELPGQERVMTGFTLLFVYMVSPLQGLLNALPNTNLARVASKRIDDITQSFGSLEKACDEVTVPAFSTIKMQQIRHRFYHEKTDEHFELGPIDISLHAGEIVFLIGGNGSGKTTLAKLLAGLYPPEDGHLLLNDTEINENNRDEYRQLFSSIFSDFHLFEQLLQTGRADVDAEGNRYLTKLHLQNKVQVRNGAFTTQSLSQGQRKRLALVVAYLEDRPFLIFDEWAADQDPLFKKFFYDEVLAELRDMGKGILVISHDDRFFDVADRIIRMENGQIVGLCEGDAEMLHRGHLNLSTESI